MRKRSEGRRSNGRSLACVSETSQRDALNLARHSLTSPSPLLLLLLLLYLLLYFCCFYVLFLFLLLLVSPYYSIFSSSSHSSYSVIFLLLVFSFPPTLLPLPIVLPSLPFLTLLSPPPSLSLPPTPCYFFLLQVSPVEILLISCIILPFSSVLSYPTPSHNIPSTIHSTPLHNLLPSYSTLSTPI